MTDQEKIQHHDALEDIRKRIGGCFGVADLIFAGHPSDEERAKELRKIAERNQVSLLEMREIVLGYLFGKGVFLDHIKEQLDRATKLFSKKLK